MILLETPHFAQRTAGYCLPACAQMALATLGRGRDHNTRLS